MLSNYKKIILDKRSPARLLRATRGLLDFVYIAQFPVQSTETLKCMTEALQQFHDNKEIFVELGIRNHFNFFKLHFLKHYPDLIRWLGSPDNFNTSYTERLHIDYAKEAYDATNHKEEFAQMTQWLERKEKIIQHAEYIQWRLAGQPPLPNHIPLHPPLPARMKIAKRPIGKVAFDILEKEYQAPFIRDALARFLVEHDHPNATPAQVERMASNYFLYTQTLPVFHQFKLWLGNPEEHKLMSDEFDIIHSNPERKGKYQKPIPARFDTVLVHLFPGVGPYRGVRGMHLFFSLNYIYILYYRLSCCTSQDYFYTSSKTF